MIAAIPPSPLGTADCINLDLSITKFNASSKTNTSAATNAAYSPKECPAKQIGLLIKLEIWFHRATFDVSIKGWVISVNDRSSLLPSFNSPIKSLPNNSEDCLNVDSNKGKSLMY